jgi:hypothetical protein
MNHHPGLPRGERAAIAAVAAVTSLSLLAGVLLLFDSHSQPELAPPLLAAGGCPQPGADPTAARAAAPSCTAARRP